ncbi:protein of unknown function [Pseudorhizobium banfieldiae]|uniref:Uncharacterized protein n=1 Tax=Pseudorhizobium banfieldiae TaxID=1125847 RepID=L0NDJ1_9HYPH|nr:protein of unknown function [Pseudorhizobium banfieldiae]
MTALDRRIYAPDRVDLWEHCGLTPTQVNPNDAEPSRKRDLSKSARCGRSAGVHERRRQPLS